MTRSLLLLVIIGLVPAKTLAQPQDVVVYYHTDAIGSVRMITDANGGVLARYDFEPFGVACGSTCGTGGTPEAIQFAGKERDTDTTFDYFGARYFDSISGRFTTVDPIFDFEAALVDPQRWNRYAYARNGPLAYGDPTGTMIELLGDPGEQKRLFEIIEGIVGKNGAELLRKTTKNGRTYVEYVGRERDALAATGKPGVLVADLIDSMTNVQFGFANLVKTKFEKTTTALKGGALTVGKEESFNGDIQVLLHPEGLSIVSRILRPLRYSYPVLTAHEFGHAWSNLQGNPIYRSEATNSDAVIWENILRDQLGWPRRRRH